MRIFSRTRLKIAAIIFLSLSIGLGLALLYYYHYYSRLIEAKLAAPLKQGHAPSEIYAAPAVLRPGRRLTYAGLINHLRRVGYRETGENKYSVETPSYRLVKSHLLDIHQPGSAGRSERFQVRFGGGAIQEIKNIDRSQTAPELRLQPELISTVFDSRREKRKYIRFKELPPPLVNAVLAAEDRRFFRHPGVDPLRAVKALFIDFKAGEWAQGGSTLTQQFVKNFFLTSEKKLTRKMAEAYISMMLERRYGKEQIFELYANSVYMGQRGSFSIVGLGEAAEAYFHKNVSDVTLPEAALLAGIIQLPNRHSPHKNLERAKTRRDWVLDAMEESEFITRAQKLQAKRQPVVVKPPAIHNYSEAPYFVDLVREQLLQQFSEEELTTRSYRIYTGLNMELQKSAYEAVAAGLKALDDTFSKRKRRPLGPGTVQAALVALDTRNGEIVALVGGRNYGESQYNRVTEAMRQPGSIFKPFVYAAALDTVFTQPESPLTAASLLMDEPSSFEYGSREYNPRNYKNEYYGLVTLREALTRSLNVPTVKLAEQVGYERVVEIARKAGLNQGIKAYPSVALGTFEVTPLEMARAYTLFANNGHLVEPLAIRRITTSHGIPLRSTETAKRKAIAPETAFMVTSLLQSVINHGTGAGARARGFVLPAAGKTGTSHDGWFAGFTPELVCIVWVGFDDNRELTLSGSQSALPIWTDFMKKAAELFPLGGENFAMPEGIVTAEVDPATGLLASAACREQRVEYFIKGTEPQSPCNGLEQFLEGGRRQAVSYR